jgi:3-oxoacyl-[acyl-carrier-protein] synthase II
MVGPAADGRGVAAAVHEALAMQASSSIGWIKAHGTGTRANDLAECRGLRTVLGPGFGATPMTSLKPALGHALGASAAIETVGVLLALESRLIPATCGTREVDAELMPCTVALEPRQTMARSVLLLAESFGGRCSALIVRAA